MKLMPGLVKEQVNNQKIEEKHPYFFVQKMSKYCVEILVFLKEQIE